MKLLLLLACSLVLLSCKKENTEAVVKQFPKYPDHPITYELKDNKLTVYRNYVSEWLVDSVTFERIPLDYVVLPELTAGKQNLVDSFHWEMVDSGVFVEQIPYHIIVNDRHPFNSLYHSVFVPIISELSCYGYNNNDRRVEYKYVTWRDLTLNLRTRDRSDNVTVYFKDGAPYVHLIHSDTTFNEPLASRHSSLIWRLHPENHANTPQFNNSVFTTSALDNHEEGTSGTGSTPINVHVATNGESLSSKQMYNALKKFETGNYRFHFCFKQDSNYDNPHKSETHPGGFTGKPIIYLYPETETTISVVLDTSINYTFTYPHYPDSGWKVTADSLGNLSDSSSGKEYYSLFWEGYTNYTCDFSEGFVVSSDEIVSFLEEKLDILGLNFREAQEFILYWAPVLEQNEFSLIHFATDEYSEAVPIEITPEPETLIRILMSFKAVNGSMQIEEQELVPVVRSGYTVVEWGGSNYDMDHLVK